MAGFIYPQTADLVATEAIKTPYATGLIKLFKEAIVFTPLLTAANLAAIEADYTGYAAKTLVTLPAAFNDPVHGGASFSIPTQQYNVGSTPTVFNDISGGWIEDADGNLLMAFQFQTPWPMQGVGDSLPLDLTLNFFGDGEVRVTVAGAPQ